MGRVENVNIEVVLKVLDEKQNFNGLKITANYAIFPPYCSIDEMGNPTGLMYDILKVVANELNLTVEIQETKPENMDIWYKKYDFLKCKIVVQHMKNNKLTFKGMGMEQ